MTKGEARLSAPRAGAINHGTTFEPCIRLGRAVIWQAAQRTLTRATALSTAHAVLNRAHCWKEVE
jgi:hypothetical protein